MKLPVRLTLVLGATLIATAPARAQTPPAKPQPLKRGTFHVEITETVDGAPAESSYCKALISRMLVLHGFKRTKKSRARYRITGKAEFKFLKRHDFKFKDSKIPLEYQYEGSVTCTIADRKPPPGVDGQPSEPREDQVSVPALKNGRRDRDSAERDIRRLVGTAIARQVVNEGPFAESAIVTLLQELENGGGRSVDVIVEELVGHGFAAAPYLLDATLEGQKVKAKGTYPGGREKHLEMHIVADYVLGRILGKSSGLNGSRDDADRTDAHRFWNRAWEDAQGVPKAYRLPRRPGEG